MSKVVQRRRGTTAEHTTFTGELGELTVDTTKDTLVVHDGAAAGGFPLLREDGSNSALALGSAGTPSLKFTGDPNTGLYSPGADQLAVATNGTGRLFVDSSGRVLAGTSTARLYTSLGYAKFQLEGTSFADSSIGLTNNQATVDGAYLVFNKTRGTAIGSVTSVQSGDLLGSIWFEGADGTNPIRGATIEAAVDGTPGANDMPGRLVFSTAADGAATPTERLRITSAGLVGIGTSSPATALEVLGFIQTQSGAFGGGGYNIKYTSNAASRSWQLLTDNTAYGDFTIQQSTTQTGSTYTPRLYISAAGNVGIGTTSPNRRLEVSDASVDNFIRVNTTGATKSGIEFTNGGTAYSQLYFNNVPPYDLSLLQQYSTGSLILGTNSTERVRIDSSGRVGIGTSSPGEALHIANGGVRISGTLAGGGANSSGLDYAAGNARFVGYGPDVSTQAGFVFLTANSTASVANERVRIDSSGNVGIGTSTPTSLLHVNQPGTTGGEYGVRVSQQSATANALRLTVDSTNGLSGLMQESTIPLVFGTNNTERLRIDSSGRLLVGTSTAISDSGFGTGRLQVTTDGLFQNVIFSAHNSTAINGSALTLARSRGSLASPTFLSAGDLIGRYQFSVWAGTEYRPTAIVEAEADLAHASGDLPSRLVFSVTADGASSPTEAMRIKNSRILNFANTPTYADNTAAKAGGLVDGDVYRKSDGTLMIVYT